MSPSPAALRLLLGSGIALILAFILNGATRITAGEPVLLQNFSYASLSGKVSGDGVSNFDPDGHLIAVDSALPPATGHAAAEVRGVDFYTGSSAAPLQVCVANTSKEPWTAQGFGSSYVSVTFPSWLPVRFGFDLAYQISTSQTGGSIEVESDAQVSNYEDPGVPNTLAPVLFGEGVFNIVSIAQMSSDFSLQLNLIATASADPGGCSQVAAQAVIKSLKLHRLEDDAVIAQLDFATNPGAGDQMASLQDVIDALQPGPLLDFDGDGYTDIDELILDKDPTSPCPTMRADVDGSGDVTILDLALTAQHFAQLIPPAPQRLNQDATQSISILDLSAMAQHFLESVLICP